jgi:hypothetical protein
MGCYNNDVENPEHSDMVNHSNSMMIIVVDHRINMTLDRK